MFTSAFLELGRTYTREELRRRFSIIDATLNTGIFQPQGHDSIWLFITQHKSADRTQYQDLLEGDTLYWQGQTAGRKDGLIIEHAVRGLEVLVFYRNRKYEHPKAAFKYMGRFAYQSSSGSHPTSFVLLRVEDLLPSVENEMLALDIEEGSKGSYVESGKQTLTRIYERNPQLRAAAIKIHGTRCQVCGFTFGEFYGQHGEGFIEVHHLRPISSYVGQVVLDPKRDMAVLCANCHRMIHRFPTHPLTLDELRSLVRTRLQ